MNKKSNNTVLDYLFKEDSTVTKEEYEKAVEEQSIYDEETEVYDEETEVFTKNYKIVRTAIREKHPEGKDFVNDTMPCPLCKNGTLKYMISDHYNGDIHAACSECCFNFME